MTQPPEHSDLIGHWSLVIGDFGTCKDVRVSLGHHRMRTRLRMSVVRRYIGVIGGAKSSRSVRKLAEDVGRGVAKSGAVLVCGGKGQLTAGMMIDTSPLNPT
jgi:hypothetical protein